MNFFNQPYRFSFKDLIAAVFIGSFLYFCWRALGSKQALELVKTMVSLIGVVLGGYFLQEGAAMYLYRNQRTRINQQPYYGIGQETNTSTYPVTDQAQQEQSEPL